MSRSTHALLTAAMAIGLVTSACSSSPDAASKTTPPATVTQLPSLTNTHTGEHSAAPTAPARFRTAASTCISWSTDRRPT